ncbi:response regulator [Caenimonas sedimenti]|uniref:histidine kinase n=1 Tax=Caenimonas sedimenti TaxID=2596921 RepID=A0A562ZWB4_9BURK|nr:ATP-binding protein [Caenimonas sedimenti]TWO72763.1 response regulator [Caenimonas sedimenti]
MTAAGDWTMDAMGPDPEAMAHENAELRIQLQEAHDTLRAIQSGDVDALIVGSDIYTLDSSNAATNKLRQDVLSQMEDSVLAFDNDHHLVFMNPAAERLYGKTASATLGRPKAEVFEETWTDDAARQAAKEALDRQGAFQAISVHRTVDGSNIHVETRVSLLRDASGARTGQLYVIRNITERVEAERALQEADRQKDEFLATLAHELRNPLAPIRNALQLMQLTPSAEVHERARHIMERQLGQMVHLVDDLLDVSRISQGKVQLRLERTDLNQIIQTAVETSRPLVEARRHALTVTLPLPQTLMVDADETRLCQVVSNLLNNAAKYTPERGTIELSAVAADGHAVVTVRDSGVGIPKEYLPKVFDLFTQIDRTLERSQGGLGIGLALVKRLVELHRGQVSVQSGGTGRGSVFTVRLPLSSKAQPALGAAPHAPLEVASAGDLRVLVVDDNVDGAETLAQVLTLVGYQTRTVHDGLEALGAAQDFLPHVIVLDIGLPHLSGHEVARRIRQQSWGREMMLIALSGWGQEEDRKKSAEAGFNKHFVKPVDLLALTDEVRSYRS